MEFDEIVVKDSPGLCRCCLSEGCYKDLGSEYTWMNDTEIYADMLLECFDIGISQHNDGPNGPSRLICEVCITRLRDACNFKKQVLESEKRFIDMVGSGQYGHKVVIYQTTMKCEALPEEPQVEEGEVEYLEEELDFGDDDVHQDDAAPEASVSEEITVAALKVKGKRGRPKKTSTIVKTERKAKVAKLEEKPRTSKAASKEDAVNSPPTDISEKKRILTLILENTTAMPFRWFSNKYMCFFCCCEFLDSSKLKEHTTLEHEDAKLNNVLKAFSFEARVKLDIANLTCKRCLQPIEDLNELTKHALEAHNVNIGGGFNEFIHVFKLSDNDLRCIDCGERFRFFGPMLIHVNKFHIKISPYLCDVCGQGFVSKGSMLHHVKYTHSATSWTCEECGKTFRSIHTLRCHRMKFHTTEKLKCPKCPEVLGSRYLRTRHLAVVHDVKSVQFPCDECSKVFILNNSLLNHQQRVHLKQKNVACNICGVRVYSKAYLKRHLVKHKDERPFECEYCNKTFQRKKTLNEHVRIHTDDRRYVCKDCGKAFIQVASLKFHLRTHHAQLPAGSDDKGHC